MMNCISVYIHCTAKYHEKITEPSVWLEALTSMAYISEHSYIQSHLPCIKSIVEDSVLSQATFHRLEISNISLLQSSSSASENSNHKQSHVI